MTTKPVLSKIKHFDFYYFDISPNLPVCTQKNNARGRSHERFGHGFLRKHMLSYLVSLLLTAFSASATFGSTTTLVGNCMGTPIAVSRLVLQVL